jgi:hypothetical protein
MSEELNQVRVSLSSLKEEIAILRRELEKTQEFVAADMKKLIELVKQNVK